MPIGRPVSLTPNVKSKNISVIATSGQTSFATSGYTVGMLDVYLNGIKLVVGTDVTATNGTSIVLAAGAAVNDIIQIMAYATVGQAERHIIKADGGSANTLYTAAQIINGGDADG